MNRRLGRSLSLLALLTAQVCAQGGGFEVEATPRPRASPGFYPTPVRVRPAPGYFRPRRHFAALIEALEAPPSARRRGRRGLGVWVEVPGRRVAPVDLPHVLHASDRVHTGPAGRARLRLPAGVRLDLGPRSILRVAGDGPDPGPRGRIRVGLERGTMRLVTPYARTVEVEVPHGLLHFENGELLVESPPWRRVHEDSAAEARVLLVTGRGALHGRGRHRREKVRLDPGHALAWRSPEPRFWRPRPIDLGTAERLQGAIGRLQPGTRQDVAEPPSPTWPAYGPRRVPTRPAVTLVDAAGPAATAASPRPSPTPPPRPTRPPTPTPQPQPPPADDGDPFGDDPFGDDPFFGGGDPFGDGGDLDF